MRCLLIDRCPLSPSYQCTLIVDGQRYINVNHYYFCEKFNWRGAFPNRDTARYYELLREADCNEVVVMLGRRLPRLKRRFKTFVNRTKTYLGTVDDAFRLKAVPIANWETSKHDAMKRAVRARLTKAELRQALHKTHKATLIYRPSLFRLRIPPSAVWGAPGINGYGRLLMQLRREIQCTSDGQPFVCPEVRATINWGPFKEAGRRRK